MPGVAFFVCGTPSNHRGFELVELGPEKLPGSPAAYLDKAPAGTAECHRIEPLLIDGQRYVQYSRVLRINPNDAEANRGAYLAVGCLIRERLPFHTVSNCLDAVSELYGRVCSGLTPDRSFPSGYRLADFTHTGPPLDERAAYQCSPVLVADVVLQALNGEGPIDWSNTRELLLAPEEMIATDVSRYQLYSRQGSLGSLASIDTDRAHLQPDRAASDDGCPGLGRAAARMGCPGRSCRALADERRSVPTPDVGDGAQRQAEPSARRRSSPRRPRQESATRPAARYVRLEAFTDASSPCESAPAGSAAQRRCAARHAPKQRHWLRGSGWAGVSVVVLIGGLLVRCRRGRGSEVLAARAGRRAGAAAGRHRARAARAASKEREQPEDDVAKERAALDALPDE